MRIHRPRAFTLLELLVVIGIITFLLAILLPSLSGAREQARSAVCKSNIRQIVVANSYYAEDSGGVFCAGASNFLTNLHRWHGQRDTVAHAFDPARGPLALYLGSDGAIRQCPTFPADEIAKHSGGFERGNGGYGYNNAFIGVQVQPMGDGTYVVATDRAGAAVNWVQRPSDTIMFTDSAFAGAKLIEYSFAEPRFHLQFSQYRAIPSIQFRHRKLANVGWVDGHVDSQTLSYSEPNMLYPIDPRKFDIGWFGKADDNRLFDLK